MDAIDITYNDETNFLADTSRDWRKWIMDLLLMAKKEIGKENNLEMSINFVDEDKSHQINRDYRDKDRPTDVISLQLKMAKKVLIWQALFLIQILRKTSVIYSCASA